MKSVLLQGGRAGRIRPWLYERIGADYAAGRRVLLLVPELYTLQAERELIRYLKIPGFLNMEVLSPTRLRQRIAAGAGWGGLSPLSEAGRTMVVSQILSAERENLRYYGNVADRASIPAHLSGLLTEMAEAGLTPEKLADLAEQAPNQAARAKLADLALIWTAMEERMAGRYADETRQQQEAVRRLGQSGVADGAAVYVYGFDLLSRLFCSLLLEIARRADSLTVTLVMDGADAMDGRIFAAQRRSAERLAGMLREAGIPCAFPEPLRGVLQDRRPALRFLEQTLFARVNAAWDGAPEGVGVHVAANPLAENRYAAQTLLRWHSAGIPWDRMAVASARPLTAALAAELEAAGIPFYMARREGVLRHGLCRLVTGALEAVSGSWRTAAVLSAAGSGFSPLTEEEVFRLENYVLANGIDRIKWTRPFTRGEDAAEMEPLRQRLMAPLTALHDRLTAARDAAASVEALWQLLADVQAYEKLRAAEEELLARGMDDEAARNRQVWKLLLSLMDQLHALLAGRRAPLKEMARLVRAGLDGASLMAIPAAADTVLVGEAGHLETGELDALLLMGMQDGVTAAAPDRTLTEAERDWLSERGRAEIGLPQELRAAMRLNGFYRTVTLPVRELAVTCADAALSGEALQPSALIGELRRIFPSLRVTGGALAESLEDPLAPIPALEELGLRLRATADGRGALPDARWQAAAGWLWQEPRYAPLMSQLTDALNAAFTPIRLAPEQALRLFGNRSVSISRLESFAACPFAHFVEYGLRPQEQKTFTFEASEKGEFYHEAMEAFAAAAQEDSRWPELPEEDVDSLLDRVLAPLTEKWRDGPLRETPLGGLEGESYVRGIRRAAHAYTRHSRNSRFTTWGTEVPFGMPDAPLPPLRLELPDGYQVALQGKIDRIDLCRDTGEVWLRVVDYKSSDRSLIPARVAQGLQLQLLLYLKAAADGIPGAVPAGAFYFPVRDPLVRTETGDPAEAEEERTKRQRLSGWVLGEKEVLEAMDSSGAGQVIPGALKRDGSLRKDADACSREELLRILEAARSKAAELACDLRRGVADIRPLTDGQWSACQWCACRPICRRDERLPGGALTQIPETDKERFFRGTPAGEGSD